MFSDTQIVTHNHEKFGAMRMFTDEHGEPWFVAKDICESLDIKNTTQALQNLDDDERSIFNIGRQGKTNIINESGLYSLIIQSRKPEAKAFRKWVTSEVLPSIRKHGLYKKESREELTEASFIERNGSFWLEMKLIAEELDHIGIPKDSENVELTFDEHKEFLVLGSAYGDNYKGYSHSDSISRSSALDFIGKLGMDVGASAGGKSGNMFSDFFNSADSNSANPVNDAYGYNPEMPAPQTPKGGANISGGVKAGGEVRKTETEQKTQQEQYDVVRMSYAYAAYDAANQADKLGITDESERAFFIKGRMDEFDTKFREEFTGVKDPREVPTEMPDMPSGNANPRIHDTKPEDIYDASTSGKYYEHKDKKD